MNLPNALSLFRILLVAPFLVAVIYGRFPLAFGLFLIAGLTDFLDGFLARRLGQKTDLGAYLDPIGDKLLITVAFISLGAKGLLPPWLAVTVVAKDVYVSLGSAILYFSGSGFFPVATIWGKFSTLLQMATMAIALLAEFFAVPALLLQALFIATGFFTIVAGLEYMWSGVRAFPEGKGSDKT